MHKKLMMTLSCIIIVCMLISVSGCIQSDDRGSKRIKSMDTAVSVGYDDIISINFTYVKQELEKDGYRVEIITLQNLGDLESSREAIERDYRVYNELYAYKTPKGSLGANEWNFDVSARVLRDNTTMSSFSVVYFPLGEYKYDEEKAEKHAEEVADKVAQICNLTINCEKMNWNIHWSDY